MYEIRKITKKGKITISDFEFLVGKSCFPVDIKNQIISEFEKKFIKRLNLFNF